MQPATLSPANHGVRRGLMVVVSLLLLSILALPAYAQASIVSAAVDRTNLSINEPLTLSMIDQLMQQSLGSLSGLGQLPVSSSQAYQQIAAPAVLQGQDYHAEAQIDKPTVYQDE